MTSRFLLLPCSLFVLHCGSAHEGSGADAGADAMFVTDQQMVLTDRPVTIDQVQLHFDRPATPDVPTTLPDRLVPPDGRAVPFDAPRDARTGTDVLLFRDAPTPFRDVPVFSPDAVFWDDVTFWSDARTVSCEPQSARLTACSPIAPPSEQGSFWDGDSCVLHGSNCEGPDCFAYRGFDALQSCKNDHSTCTSQICVATGGTWDVVGRCAGGVRCGVYPNFDCDGPTHPLCNCGPGRTFDPIGGCLEDPTCGLPELCDNTGGEWLVAGDGCAPCDSCAGACPALCAPILENRCHCGPFATFDRTLGCVPSDRCSTDNKRSLCTTQGGSWIAPGCCDRVDACGHHAEPRCLALCVPDETCVCPRGYAWSGRGCVISRCDLRLEGEACDDTHACEGTLNCTYCGGASGGGGGGGDEPADIVGRPDLPGGGGQVCRYPACGFADNCLLVP